MQKLAVFIVIFNTPKTGKKCLTEGSSHKRRTQTNRAERGIFRGGLQCSVKPNGCEYRQHESGLSSCQFVRVWGCVLSADRARWNWQIC